MVIMIYSSKFSIFNRIFSQSLSIWILTQSTLRLQKYLVESGDLRLHSIFFQLPWKSVLRLIPIIFFSSSDYDTKLAYFFSISTSLFLSKRFYYIFRMHCLQQRHNSFVCFFTKISSSLVYQTRVLIYILLLIITVVLT